jgi:hypothetical protein
LPRTLVNVLTSVRDVAGRAPDGAAVRHGLLSVAVHPRDAARIKEADLSYALNHPG